ncbi:MAG: type II secretion system protein [Thermoguttaceae bacterium]|jgi:prepilin-type N-terminal cleavage/methylation domain-containing protein
MHRLQPDKRCRGPGVPAGFTLLELSIVLAIIAAIVAGGMTIFASSLQKDELKETQNKLKAIQKALLAFRVANNRLPCPADVTLAPANDYFGYEAGSLVNSGWVPDTGACTTYGTYVNDALTATAANSVAADFYNSSAASSLPALSGNAASFVSEDTKTQGNWIGVYGASGYSIEGIATSLPAYASVSFTGDATYTWTSPAPASDVRGLQNPGSPTTHTATCWYNSPNFTINVGVTDGNTHQIGLYAVDWDSYGPRQESITVENASTNAVLDTRTLSSFVNGQYYIWNIAGNVTFVITDLVAHNAVISALFFTNAATVPAAEGMVPTQTLRLSDDYAFDGWGRRIMYTVDNRFTAIGAFTTILPTDITSRLTVNDPSSNTKTVAAAYVLVSFGPNGHGAYPRNGAAIASRISSGSNNGDEQNNCDCNSSATSNSAIPGGTFVQEQPNQASGHIGDPTYYYDDIVAYGTRSDLRSPTE